MPIVSVHVQVYALMIFIRHKYANAFIHFLLNSLHFSRVTLNTFE